MAYSLNRHCVCGGAEGFRWGGEEALGLGVGSFGESTVAGLRAEGAARSTGLTKALPCGRGEPQKVLELEGEQKGCADTVIGRAGRVMETRVYSWKVPLCTFRAGPLYLRVSGDSCVLGTTLDSCPNATHKHKTLLMTWLGTRYPEMLQ